MTQNKYINIFMGNFKRFLFERKDLEYMENLVRISKNILKKFIKKYEIILSKNESLDDISLKELLSVENDGALIIIRKRSRGGTSAAEYIRRTPPTIVLYQDGWCDYSYKIFKSSGDKSERKLHLQRIISYLNMILRNDIGIISNLVHELAHYYDIEFNGDPDRALRQLDTLYKKYKTDDGYTGAMYKTSHEIHAYFLDTLHALISSGRNYSDFYDFLRAFIRQIGPDHWEHLRDRQQKSIIKRLYDAYNKKFN